jgi:hypothetical protein
MLNIPTSGGRYNSCSSARFTSAGIEAQGKPFLAACGFGPRRFTNRLPARPFPTAVPIYSLTSTLLSAAVLLIILNLLQDFLHLPAQEGSSNLYPTMCGYRKVTMPEYRPVSLRTMHRLA